MSVDQQNINIFRLILQQNGLMHFDVFEEFFFANFYLIVKVTKRFVDVIFGGPIHVMISPKHVKTTLEVKILQAFKDVGMRLKNVFKISILP